MLRELNKKTKVIIQGITGKEGERVAGFMLDYGVKVVAGVRPGKGGEKVLGVPVFNSVSEAVEVVGEVKVSCVYVPPVAVKGAAIEALEAGVKMLHIIGEGVPVLDSAYLLELATERGAKILGPASLGMMRPGEFKVGSLGGGDNSAYTPGEVGIISRSGGMSSEMAEMLTRKGRGQSMVVHVGGDYLVGYSPAEVLREMEADLRTKQVILIGEVGGGYEREVADELESGRITKPVIVMMAGAFVESLPQQVPLGHAGAIIQGEADTRGAKLSKLEKAGARVARRLDEVLALLD